VLPIWEEELQRVYDECGQWRERVLDEVRATKPKLVILGGRARYRIWDGTTQTHADARVMPEAAAGEVELINSLRASGSVVVVIRDNPALPQKPIACLISTSGQEHRCAWARKLC
jgi:hypothetical protein